MMLVVVLVMMLVVALVMMVVVALVMMVVVLAATSFMMVVVLAMMVIVISRSLVALFALAVFKFIFNVNGSKRAPKGSRAAVRRAKYYLNYLLRSIFLAI
jgi:hypothetical protein